MNTKKSIRNPKYWVFLLVALGFVLAQCAKDDSFTLLTSEDVTGEYTINTTDNSWRFDKAHSNVQWKTAYVGDQAWLTGRFNKFAANVDFDQQDLANSSINGWVVLSTGNTGEPGRDALGKCLNGYLGVAHNGDTLQDGSLDPAGIIASSDTAKFITTSIMEFGDAYKAVGTLNFRGQTSDIEMIFDYITEKDYSSAQDGSNIRASFSGEFDFLAKTDHGVTSTSIADLVTVELNAQFRKN